MSYILDALKQSDKQRQMSSELDSVVPSITGVDEVAPERKRYWVLAGVVIFVLFIGGIYIYSQEPVVASDISVQPPELIVEDVVLQSGPDEKAKQALYGVSIKLDETPPAVLATTPELAHLNKDTATVPVKQTPAALVTVAPPAKQPVKPVEIKAADSAEVAVVVKPVAAPETFGSGSVDEVIYWRQLPAGVQRELPQLKFSVHIYSRQPASRMVKVNGRMLREGDLISGQVRLDEITRSGVILTYKGYRFRMSSV